MVEQEHRVIYLEPRCSAEAGEDRHWCQDDTWGGACDECGTKSVKYIIASEHDQLTLAVDLLEKNAAIQAKLLADTARQRDALATMLEEARLQIEYMQSKFDQTGTGNAVLARINATLSVVGGARE